MNRLFRAGSMLIIALLSGCSGGGNGGAAVPYKFVVTKYKGEVADARFGQFKVDVNYDELSRYPGRVSTLVTFKKYDAVNDRLTNDYIFHIAEPTGQERESYITPIDGQINPQMGTWPDGVPVSNYNGAICFLDLQAKFTPDLNPGSTVTIQYRSTSCDFLSSGSFVANYDTKEVYDQS